MELPRTILSRDRKQRGHPTGGTRHCQMAGCTGLRIAVRWPDGKLTWPCTKGMVETKRHWRLG